MSIIKHPNGRYSIFSSIVDDFIYIGITKKQYLKIRQEELKQEVDDLFIKLNNHPEFYGKLDEKLKIIEMVHGKERKDKVLKLINKTG